MDSKTVSVQVCEKECTVGLFVLQDVNSTFITFYLILISLTFVSRTDQLWKLKPRKSWQILVTGLCISVLQIIYLTVNLVLYGAKYISVFTWSLYTFSLFLTIILNEFIKRHEIKVNLRFQKRARLDFGTKLGINSPF